SKPWGKRRHRPGQAARCDRAPAAEHLRSLSSSRVAAGALLSTATATARALDAGTRPDAGLHGEDAPCTLDGKSVTDFLAMAARGADQPRVAPPAEPIPHEDQSDRAHRVRAGTARVINRPEM